MASTPHGRTRARRRSGFVFRTVLLCAFVGSAAAGEPFVTDDARVIPPGTCKIEGGKRAHPDGRQLWLLPACNLFFNMEVELGLPVDLPDGEPRSASYVVQGKGLWREIERDGYGLGWLVNTDIARHPEPGSRRVREYAALLLASYPAIEERLTLHANLGTRWNRDQRQGALTGGVLAELELNRRVALLAEIYGLSHVRRGLQAGVRVTLVPDQLDLSVSRGGDDADARGRRYWAVSVEAVSKPRRTR